MTQYINKSTLVAEIEKRIKEISKEFQESKYIQYTLLGKINALENLLPFLDTLEVKEINSTDAFIKKVEDYLNSQLYDWVNVTNPDQRSCANIIPKKDFVEDFKNNMKGE